MHEVNLVVRHVKTTNLSSSINFSDSNFRFSEILFVPALSHELGAKLQFS